MMLALLLTGAATAAATCWALTAAPGSRRALRYVELGPDARQLPLAGTYEAVSGRLGLTCSPSIAGSILALVALGGLGAGALLHQPLLGLLMALVGLALKLRWSRLRRTARLTEQLPDALMLMASALKSGLGFHQALQMVAEETAAPLAGEFKRLADDFALGVPADQALRRLQDRLGSIDGEVLVSALLVQRQTGSNLSELLGNLHQTIRERQALQGQVRALTAQGKLSGLVLTALPIVLGVAFYVLNPTYMMTLFIDPRGRAMVLGALGMMAVGAFLIRRIVTIRM